MDLCYQATFTNSSQEELRQAWGSVLRPFGVSETDSERAYQELARRFRDPGRFYHNLVHVQEVLTVIDRLKDVTLNKPAVRLAAWYHDAIYDPRAADNEEKSAAYADRSLRGLGVPGAIIADCCGLILTTKAHTADPVDRDAHVLLDADLSILGATEARYHQYARQIRQEYAWLPDVTFRKGRSRVLMAFLQRESIFRTAVMAAECELSARTNLKRELAELVVPRNRP